jgi:hypothetical protein
LEEAMELTQDLIGNEDICKETEIIPIHVGLHSKAEIKEMYFLHIMSYLQII